MSATSRLSTYLRVHPEVAEALATQQPVVALESTIISHGMPWPENASTARQLEQQVRDCGAIPATIALMDGRLCVGLDHDQLQYLAQASGVCKASRRDIPRLLAAKALGATTVAATMIVAGLAGIRVFATGGIGGVHRDVHNSGDVSADLVELSQTPVAVVCAGVKSILDIPRTLEFLETFGVAVYGYKTDRFPAFYTPDSGESVDASFGETDLLAQAIQVQWDLGYKSGVVVANPIAQSDAMPKEVIDAAVSQALSEAKHQAIKGKAATPFLLKRVAEITGGDSLRSNIALVLANAAVAAQLAVSLEAMRPKRAIS